MTRVSRGANLYQIKQRIYPFKDKFCNTSIQMIYIYTTKIKDKVIREKGVGRFIFAVNSEVGVPLLTANILYNYFSRPDQMKASAANSINITREQFFYVV